MDIKELFRGFVVIIDDEIEKEDSEIAHIKENLLQDHIPVVCYEKIPDIEVIESLSDAAFIILDWDFWDREFGAESKASASTLKEEIKREWIDFIKVALDALFVPIFIFSGQDIDEIKRELTEESLYVDGEPNRIFIKSKSDIGTEDALFQSIEDWIREMPSVYALKKLEKQVREAKNKMFVTWYGYSPQWTTVIWNLIAEDVKKDGEDDTVACQQEFGEFLIKNLTNRVELIEFNEDCFQADGESNGEEIKKVLEYERYIKYDDPLKGPAYTGDLYKGEHGEYYLNVRAQCELSRKGDNVQLYLLKGKEISEREIVTEAIQITDSGDLLFSGTSYDLKKMINSGNQDSEGRSKIETTEELKKLNSKLKKYNDNNFYRKGTILEKANEAFIACIDDGKIIRFKMDIEIKPFNEIKDKRLGRILPPYITRIQQKCAHRMIHAGELPLPKEVFDQ